jgi:amino acid transporter
VALAAAASRGVAPASMPVTIEATAIYREEARTPDRTVPRATYVVVGFLGLFYASISWVIIQAPTTPARSRRPASTRPACSSPR